MHTVQTSKLRSSQWKNLLTTQKSTRMIITKLCVIVHSKFVKTVMMCWWFILNLNEFKDFTSIKMLVQFKTRRIALGDNKYHPPNRPRRQSISSRWFKIETKSKSDDILNDYLFNKLINTVATAGAFNGYNVAQVNIPQKILIRYLMTWTYFFGLIKKKLERYLSKAANATFCAFDLISVTAVFRWFVPTAWLSSTVRNCWSCLFKRFVNRSQRCSTVFALVFKADRSRSMSAKQADRSCWICCPSETNTKFLKWNQLIMALQSY